MDTSMKQRPSVRPSDRGDRRSAPRYLACVPVKFEPAPGIQRLGVFREVSVTGAMLMTQGPLPIGHTVRVELYLTKDATRAQLTNARVVRVQRRTVPDTYWDYDAALHFEAPLTGDESEAATFSEKQRQLGLIK